MTASPTPHTQLPPRLLPVLYFGAAHGALAFAFGAVALDPRDVSNSSNGVFGRIGILRHAFLTPSSTRR